MVLRGEEQLETTGTPGGARDAVALLGKKKGQPKVKLDRQLIPNRPLLKTTSFKPCTQSLR